ncbi:MAG: LarC family nickel insertion protein [Candidatus Njordarchaeales archaeon]
MNVLIIDPRTGIGGDMLAGALISLGVNVSLAIQILEEFGEIHIKRLPEGIKIETVPKLDHLTMDEALEIIEKSCERLNIKGVFRDFALKAIKILFEAEENAHKTFNIGTLAHLHEASDVIIDTILVAFSLQYINPSEIYCLYPVYYGGGTVRFSHGVFEAPAPATRYIIRKYNILVEKGPVATELLTPTGAALLAALDPLYVHRKDCRKNFEIWATGRGLGTKELPIPNVLSVYLARKREGIFLEKIVELETNIDDVSPEIIGDIFRDIPEALDIHVIPIICKKNRPGYLLRIWCYEEDEKTIVEKLFKLIGTLGIRRYVVERYVKPRWVKVKKIKIGDKEFRIRFKNSKPEHEDLVKIAHETGLSVLELERMILSGDIEVLE